MDQRGGHAEPREGAGGCGVRAVDGNRSGERRSCRRPWVRSDRCAQRGSDVYDNPSAASGNVLFVIPASTGVGAYKLPVGIKATQGIYASFGGTGTVNFLVG